MKRIPFWLGWFYRIQFDDRVRSDIWRLMRDLTSEKMQEGDALDAITDIYRQKGQGAIVLILQQIRHSIGMNTFNAVINKYVTTSEKIMFGARGSAEASHLYGGAFRVIETQRNMKKTIFGTILQSMLAFVVVLVLYYILGTQMYPAFIAISPLEEWSAFPRTVARVAIMYVQNIEIVMAVILVLVVLMHRTIKHYKGPGRVTLDRFPPFSLYRITTGVAFLMAIVERGRMGGALNTSLLNTMARQSTGYVRNRIEKIAELADQEVGGIGSAAHHAGQGFPSPELALIMAKYSERGGSGWLNNFSAFLNSWVEDIQNRIKAMAIGLNLFILVIVAGSIGIAMFSIFTIVNEIQNIQ